MHFYYILNKLNTIQFYSYSFFIYIILNLFFSVKPIVHLSYNIISYNISHYTGNKDN